MNQNQNRDEIRAKDLWRAKNGMPQDNGNNKTPGGTSKNHPGSLLVLGAFWQELLLTGDPAEITGFPGWIKTRRKRHPSMKIISPSSNIEGTIGDSDENYNQQ